MRYSSLPGVGGDVATNVCGQVVSMARRPVIAGNLSASPKIDELMLMLLPVLWV